MSTYTPIATQTLGSAASSVIFSSIPQGYTDLVLISSAKYTTTNGTLVLTFNSDTGSSYSTTYVYGQGSLAESGRQSNISNLLVGRANTTVFGVGRTNIQNYSNTTTYKTVLDRADLGSGTNPLAIASVGLWRNTSAITSLTITALNSDTFASGSTFTIYGIAVGNSSAKADGGSSVTTDGTYWYHTYRSSGAFTPRQALTVDYLVVAGGGGGGGFGGGGGAGGMRCTVGATGGSGSLESALSLTSGATYTVAVGAGGIAGGINGGNAYTAGGNGSNSVFATITSTGGGGGATGGSGGSGPFVAATGGSGGGGGASGNLTGAAASPAGQGFGGGNGVGASTYSGGGGGGAGAAGSGAAGGAGRTTSISGTSTTYGGGGGGLTGAGGSGGGGAGGIAINTNPSGVAGTANTGGGGGGGNNNVGQFGAVGGSGIVIIRYAV